MGEPGHSRSARPLRRQRPLAQWRRPQFPEAGSRWSFPGGFAWRIELSTNFGQWPTVGTAQSAGTAYTFQPAENLPQPALLRVAYP